MPAGLLYFNQFYDLIILITIRSNLHRIKFGSENYTTYNTFMQTMSIREIGIDFTITIWTFLLKHL